MTDGHLKQENQLSTIGIGDTSENCFQIGFPEMENDLILYIKFTRVSVCLSGQFPGIA